MATKSLGYKKLTVIAVGEGATTPDPGDAGMWAWSTTLGRPVFWNGDAWISTQPNIIVSDTAPSSPYTGQLWLDTST